MDHLLIISPRSDLPRIGLESCTFFNLARNLHDCEGRRWLKMAFFVLECELLTWQGIVCSSSSQNVVLSVAWWPHCLPLLCCREAGHGVSEGWPACGANVLWKPFDSVYPHVHVASSSGPAAFVCTGVGKNADPPSEVLGQWIRCCIQVSAFNLTSQWFW